MDPRGTAVVTGASSGIGAAAVRALADDGWQVVAAARRRDRLEELCAELPTARAVTVDVTSASSLAELAATVPECSLLVANAGAALDAATVADADPALWRDTYELNVIGTVRTVQSLLPALTRADRGQIILTGSTAGRWVYEGGGSYVAAKHALAAVRDTLRLELVGTGIRVSEIAPGMVRTEEFALNRFGGDAERAAAVYHGVDPLIAADVAEAIRWVAGQPPHVNIDLVQLTPQQQAGVKTVHCRE